MSYEEYERPENFNEWSIDERLDHIVERLDSISKQETYRDYRKRFASDEQYDEEYGPESGYEEHLKALWFSAKGDYYLQKDEYEAHLENNRKSDIHMLNIEAMRKVVNDEVEALLLNDLTDSIDD